jgi:phosphoglycerate dehydrogenase-like enzyme
MEETLNAGRPYIILYAEPLPEVLVRVVRRELPSGDAVLRVLPSRDRDILLREIADVEFLIVASTRIDAEVLAHAPRLRHIQHQGVGLDNIDLEAAAKAGVSVAITPEGTSVGVAEHVFLLALALYKRLRSLDNDVRSGRWPVWEYRHESYELAGKKLGLIGLGRIGREVAVRARAFQMEVQYFDVSRMVEDEEIRLGVCYRELEALLTTCDIVSLHLPLTSDSRHIMNYESLSLMLRTAILLNTARGDLIDETALVQVLSGRLIAGAGLDVLSCEPPLEGNPLLSMDNVIVTPHVAAGTRDAFIQKVRGILANIERVANGEVPRHLVPPSHVVRSPS